MDLSLCGSEILLALQLTDSEKLTEKPGAFCLSAPTLRDSPLSKSVVLLLC